MKKKQNKKNNQKDYTKTMSIARNCQNGVRLARPTNPLFFEGQSVEVSGGCFFGVGSLSEFLGSVFFFLFFFAVFFSIFFEKKTNKKQNKKTEKKKGVTPGPRSPGPPATQPPLTLHWRNLVPVETILCDIQVYAVFCCALFFPFVLPCFSICFYFHFVFSICFYFHLVFSICFYFHLVFFDLFLLCFFLFFFLSFLNFQ